MAVVPLAIAERTRLKPGWNLFTPEQDVELGRQVAADAEQKLPMLRDRRVDDYLNRLGLRLASKAPGADYPYQFKAVNDASINAFALPGGFLYINRGTIEAADTEAQLAGVIGHEIGHVALRHGTNQASKSYALQAPLAVLGGVVGSNSIGGVLAQIGGGFVVNSVLLKYSRDDERQADILGVQMLYDSGYDPRAMAQFFEKLESRGGSDFFSSHPNPENRMQNISAEIQKIGGRRDNFAGSGDFEQIKRYVASMPAPRGGTASQPARQNGGGERPRAPRAGSRTYENDDLRLQYPSEWQIYERSGGFTIAPSGGLVDSNEGSALAYGVMMAISDTRSDRRYRMGLEEATDRLIDQLQDANPSMRVTRDPARIRVANEAGMSTTLSNASPLGGRETDWVVTVLRPEGLVYFVFVAPEREYGQFQRAYEQILSSLRFRN
jgi:hypothetical protein